MWSEGAGRREIRAAELEQLYGSFPLFREGKEDWRPLPSWAQFFLSVGYQLQSTVGGARRIILMTTPCESAGAAILTLGAMCFRLTQGGADDLAAHFARIQALTGVDHVDRPLWDIRSKGKRAGPFLVKSIEPDTGHVWVQHSSVMDNRQLITLASAMNWRFYDEPPLQLQGGAHVPYLDLYKRLVPDTGVIRPENLKRSDSVICLMTRLRGETATRSVAADIRFSVEGAEAGLDELLTVRQWAAEKISRVVLFNTRTGVPDRQTRSAHLVVADGDQAFLNALDEPTMQEADVIGIVPRVLDRDRLEALGHRLAHLEQWYRRDNPSSAGIWGLPPRILAALLTRRST